MNIKCKIKFKKQIKLNKLHQKFVLKSQEKVFLIKI